MGKRLGLLTVKKDVLEWGLYNLTDGAEMPEAGELAKQQANEGEIIGMTYFEDPNNKDVIDVMTQRIYKDHPEWRGRVIYTVWKTQCVAQLPKDAASKVRASYFLNNSSTD